MINLISRTHKEDIRAARTNVVLVRYTLIVLLAAGFIFGVLYTSYGVLQATKANAEALISSNDTKADVYSTTQQQVSALSIQLNDAKLILDQEVRYSKLIVNVGQLMPEGTLLDSLPIDSALIGGTPIQVKAYAKKSGDAVILQERFKASALFSEVSIQATNETGGIEGYPVVITMTITFNRSGAQ